MAGRRHILALLVVPDFFVGAASAIFHMRGSKDDFSCTQTLAKPRLSENGHQNHQEQGAHNLQSANHKEI